MASMARCSTRLHPLLPLALALAACLSLGSLRQTHARLTRGSADDDAWAAAGASSSGSPWRRGLRRHWAQRFRKTWSPGYRTHTQSSSSSSSSSSLAGMKLIVEASNASPVPVTRAVVKRTDYCGGSSFLYSANGTITTQMGAWNASCANSRFEMGPCFQVSGIHMAETFNKTVIVTDRTDLQNSYMYFPSKTNPLTPNTSDVAYGEEINLVTGEQRPLRVLSNTFCSTGVFLPNGTMLSVGGNQLCLATPTQPCNQTDGFAIRSINPCNDKNCSFILAGSLGTQRWYPTAQLLADGTMFVAGGSYLGRFINNAGYNNPTVEYFPPRTPGEKPLTLKFLKDSQPYNLYPFVHLLPSGLVFLFGSQSWTLFNTTSNTEKTRTGGYPSLKVNDTLRGTYKDSLNRTRPYTFYFLYPATGSSALLPLGPANNYKAEVIICGGNSEMEGRGGYFNFSAFTPAHSSCWRIFPEDPTPVWVEEKMCSDYPACTKPMPRVMGDVILLADGTMLVINGGQNGYAGIPNGVAQTQMRPVRYDPYSHQWFNETLCTSNVPRVYHTSALLLHNGTVLISGSNPNNGLYLAVTATGAPNPGGRYYPAEFRSEFFYPPYFYKGFVSPRVGYSPSSVPLNKTFSICFTTYDNATAADLRFALSHPGYATHSNRHGMRHVDLALVQLQKVSAGSFAAMLRAPPTANIAPPTYYWLFVLYRGVPNTDGIPVQVALTGTVPSTFPPSQCSAGATAK